MAGADLGRLARGEVVAVEGDVDLARGQLRLDEVGDQPVQPRGEVGAAAVDADERDLPVGVLLDDLVGDPHERPPHVVLVEDDLLLAHLPRSFLASRGRVKGTAEEPSSVRGGDAGEPAAREAGRRARSQCVTSARECDARGARLAREPHDLDRPVGRDRPSRPSCRPCPTSWRRGGPGWSPRSLVGRDPDHEEPALLGLLDPRLADRGGTGGRHGRHECRARGLDDLLLRRRRGAGVVGRRRRRLATRVRRRGRVARARRAELEVTIAQQALVDVLGDDVDRLRIGVEHLERGVAVLVQVRAAHVRVEARRGRRLVGVDREPRGRRPGGAGEQAVRVRLVVHVEADALAANGVPSTSWPWATRMRALAFAVPAPFG